VYHESHDESPTFATVAVSDDQIAEMQRDLDDVLRCLNEPTDGELEQMAEHARRELATTPTHYRSMYDRWERRQAAKKRRAARKQVKAAPATAVRVA